MRKIVIGIVIIAMVLAGWYSFSNEAVPESKAYNTYTQETSPADVLANKMLKAINKEAWDNIHFVQWTFRDKRHFVWDKFNHLVQVRWKEYVVLINPNTSKGVVYHKDELITGEQADELVQKAIDYFNNDSFWFNAPVKVFDNGTVRSIVDHKGKDALMVKYTTGGSTPGDSYLWILNEEGMPVAWKMWVSNIPIGEMKLTWEEWAEFDGTMLAQYHKGNVFNLRISNIKTGSKLADLGIEENIFVEID